MELPGYLSWPVMKQILWLCSQVLNFIYHDIVSNVGLSIILYTVFAYLLLSPFSIKKIFDRIKARKVYKEIEELKAKYLVLPEEERKKEEVIARYKEEEKEIRKGKSSKGIGCLMIILRLFVVLASTPVIRYFGDFVKPSPESYMFLGFDLSSPPPGYSLQPTLIFPILTSLILVIPGYISTWKNLKERKEIQAKKTEQELEEEARMLKEMGVKESKIPWAWIFQIGFTWLYFHSFSHIDLTVSFFWGAYYAIGLCTRGLINFVFTKVNK